ncbi:MAG: hypothetical protein QG608_1481, partial [Actinomycetota bacterium]|nr:hypothetical protein [Actinomycetota bacterium]
MREGRADLPCGLSRTLRSGPT